MKLLLCVVFVALLATCLADRKKRQINPFAALGLGYANTGLALANAFSGGMLPFFGFGPPAVGYGGGGYGGGGYAGGGYGGGGYGTNDYGRRGNGGNVAEGGSYGAASNGGGGNAGEVQLDDSGVAYAGAGAYGGAGYGGGVGGGGGYGYNRGGFFGLPWIPIPIPVPIQPWYKGPNVCITESNLEGSVTAYDIFNSEFGDSQTNYNQASETCKGNSMKYVCIGTKNNQNYKKKYECCHGYVPDPRGVGCIEIDLRGLLPTLTIMGASEMVKIAESVGLTEDLHRKNYTLFCPLNSALETFQERLEEDIDNNLFVKSTRRKLKKKTALHRLLTTHMVPSFVKSGDLNDGDILATEHLSSRIRINVYYIPEKVMTANCIPVVSEDHFARNGMIHVVEKVLPMPVKTVADIVAGDAQFSVLKAMLSRAGLVQALRNPNGTFTFFAPTDSSFASSSAHRQDTRCAVSVMKHYIIDHVICSSALPSHAKSLNLIGELLTLTRDKHNKLYVDGVQLVVRDLVAVNGVVHVIDGLLTTRQTKPLSQVLEESGLDEFLALLEMANLTTEFDSMDDVTFYIPTDEVIKDIPRNYFEFLNNNKSLRNLLLYHASYGQPELNVSEQVLPSRLENTTIRVQVHSTYPHVVPQVLVQCATVLSADNKLCRGTLHVINKLLLPPEMSILEFLEKTDAFHTLVLLLRATGLDRRLNSDVPYTLLAPTDDAFHQMGDVTLFQILENLEIATDLVKAHILPGAVCCSKLKSHLFSGRRQARAIDGSPLKLERSLDGALLIEGARIVDCDIMTSNGIVHMVDAVINQNGIAMLNGGFRGNVFIRI